MGTPEQELVSDLMLSLLAVNRWTLEQSAGILPALRKHGLLDLNQVSRRSNEEVTRRLEAAGYRSGLCKVVAPRWRATAQSLSAGGLATLAELDRSGRTSDIRDFLLKLAGVGPMVVNSYLALRSSSTDEGERRQLT